MKILVAKPFLHLDFNIIECYNTTEYNNLIKNNTMFLSL